MPRLCVYVFMRLCVCLCVHACVCVCVCVCTCVCACKYVSACGHAFICGSVDVRKNPHALTRHRSVPWPSPPPIKEICCWPPHHRTRTCVTCCCCHCFSGCFVGCWWCVCGSWFFLFLYMSQMSPSPSPPLPFFSFFVFLLSFFSFVVFVSYHSVRVRRLRVHGHVWHLVLRSVSLCCLVLVTHNPTDTFVCGRSVLQLTPLCWLLWGPLHPRPWFDPAPPGQLLRVHSMC
jgi:hypothetical protein